MREFIIAQILGMIALILVCLGYFQKKKTSFLIFQVFANIFYAFSFLVQGAFVGAFLTFISVLRSIIFYICQKKEFKYTYIFLILILISYVTTTIIFWDSWFDIIPLITSTIFTFAFYIKDIRLTRFIMIPPNAMLVLYNIYTKTYVNSLLAILEIGIAIISNIKSKNQAKIIKENI